MRILMKIALSEEACVCLVTSASGEPFEILDANGATQCWTAAESVRRLKVRKLSHGSSSEAELKLEL